MSGGPQLVCAARAARQPWRNGKGRTRELLAWPGGDGFRLRISVADIEADAAFSCFAGVQRWFAVLEGAGVELEVDGTRHRLTRQDPPFTFDGAAAVHCRLLDGPTQDLNLMLRGLRGGMTAADDGVAWQPPPGSVCGLYTAVAGRCLPAGAPAAALPAQALLWFADGEPGTIAFHAAQPAVGTVGWWLWASEPEPEPTPPEGSA